MTGASSREEEYWTKFPSPAKTVTDPHTDEDTIVILAVVDRGQYPGGSRGALGRYAEV